MKVRLTVGVCACALAWQLALQPAVARDGPDRPQVVRKSNPAPASHALASSLAPRARSKRGAYGAPIQPAIVKSHKPAKRKSAGKQAAHP